MSISLLKAQDYNPDILNTLANLSSDEVFTPPEVANQVLDLLPQELFSSPDTTFLDPATKSGVFLREIARRLMTGLAKQIPDAQARRDHIFHKQLFGIAITEITSHMSRRSLYCSKFPNGRYSVSRFDSAEGNIRFQRKEHQFEGGRCVWCGASETQFDKEVREGLEYHAYEFIHTHKPEDIFGMKFDVIIGNPPYQISDGGNNASATPLYHEFVSQAKKLMPRFLTMIIPSRWFTGGRGLNAFREEMLHDHRIKEIHDFENSDDCFPGVEVAGGVCYFLWDRDYSGKCKVVNSLADDHTSKERYLDELHIFIRSNNAVSIVNKILSIKEKTYNMIVSAQKPFGLRTYARPEKVGDLILRWNGGKGPIPSCRITTGREMIDKWKVIVSRVIFEHAGKIDKNGQKRVLSILEILEPYEVCSETYIVIDSFETKSEAENLITYLRTKLVRFLIVQIASSIMVTKNSFSFVPVQDFSKPWTDAELYAKYGLTDEEIAFIESMIRPMDPEGDENEKQ